MFIGSLEEQTGVSRETIRYYERRGLITAANRRDSGYREFGRKQVRELNFILRAKQLGFTLEEIRELLELRITGQPPCSQVRHKADEKLQHVEERIADLKQIQKQLRQLIGDCRKQQQSDECTILKSLEGHNEQ